MNEKSETGWGLLGGGQLSRMLLEAAQKMGVTEPQIYCASVQDPAPLLLKSKSHWRDSQKVDFSEMPKTVWGFESEFWDLSLLEAAPVTFVPSLDCMRVLQNKLEQKKLLQKLNITTANFDLFLGEEKLQNKECVLKWDTQGYDGKGVFFYSEKTRDQLAPFLKLAEEKNARVFVEDKINFRRELAMSACRSAAGQMVFYPAVFTEQQNGMCKKVFGPASAFKFEPPEEHKIQDSLRKIAEELNYVGVLSMELFEGVDKKLYVNELAPRVHNSAHYTQDAMSASQFENHVRAMLEIELVEPTLTSPFFGMLNILGKEKPSFEMLPECRLHWYEKAVVQSGRKMGHVNVLSATKQELLTRLREIEGKIYGL